MDNHLEDILFHQYIRIALVSVTISITFLAYFDKTRAKRASSEEILFLFFKANENTNCSV